MQLVLLPLVAMHVFDEMLWRTEDGEQWAVRLHVARCKVLIPLAHANQTHSLHSLAHLAQLNQTRATALYSLAVAGLSMARRPGYGEPRNQTRPK
jgi:hypothetical protein